MGKNDKSEMHRSRRGKNIALGLALVGFCVLFYVITIAKMGTVGG
ncbi:MAG: hypothetical protein RIC36_14625 [Rhodospirillales bacterium]